MLAILAVLVFGCLLIPNSQDLVHAQEVPAKPATQEQQKTLQEKQKTPPMSLSQLKAMNLTAKAFRIAAKKIRPSLVTIESFAGVSAVQGQIGGIRKQGEGNTTGLLISDEGHIITSTFNFIQRPPVITVITSDGKRRFAKMLGRDDSRKLCILKVDDLQDLPMPNFVDPESLRIGQWVVSMGVGYGDANPAVSIGIVSATNRIGGRAIQTDANISPANYGGPLIDISGNVVGICVPMNPQSQAVGAGVEWYDSGIGFAIPLFGKEDWLEKLKAGEKIYPAFLGIEAVPNQGGAGVIIEKVVPKSPANKAGIERLDRITKLNGKQVSDIMMLKQQLNRYEAGDVIELEIYSDPADQLSDDEIARRKADGVDINEDGDRKVVQVKLSAPPTNSKQNSPLEPPKIR